MGHRRGLPGGALTHMGGPILTTWEQEDQSLEEKRWADHWGSTLLRSRTRPDQGRAGTHDQPTDDPLST